MPAGATPIPESPNCTVTSRSTVAPSAGVMMYTFASAGASCVGSAGAAASASAAIPDSPKPIQNLCMMQLLEHGPPIITRQDRGSSRADRRRSAFDTTDTDDRLIASAAIIGDSTIPRTGYNTPAAIGTPMALYTNAKNRFWWMLRTVARDSA